MAIVNFESIRMIQSGEAQSPGGALRPPLTDVVAPTDSRTKIYDPIWGYFRFGQSVEWSFDDTGAGRSLAVFTIQGVFSAGAERALGTIPENGTDTDAFNALVSRMQSLEDLFSDAAVNPPSDFDLWYTNSIQDPRLIELPSPLRDRHDNAIYALPLSFGVDQTRFPDTIRYTAILQEAKLPPYKGEIGSIPIDNMTINIKPPTPIAVSHRLPGAAGEFIQIDNYTRTRVQVSGSISNQVGELGLVGATAKSLSEYLSNPRFSISLNVRSDTGERQRVTVFRNLLTLDPKVDVSSKTHSADFSVEGVE